MDRTVYVVPHTHWDREWYQPFELFRWRLVQMIDDLLDHMERHPEYRCFNLDGQSIVIDDYLQMRPENEGRLRALIQEGRILIGPWWVQPDEFLPSGESHIRSFQKGIRYAQRLGGSLRVGHCADQFGHIAQMPQIMAQLGLTSACLWRGVSDEVPGWSFWWQSPDGTRLPVLYLRNSYSSGWRLPAEPSRLIERTQREAVARRDGEPLLLMNGTDHSRFEKHVPEALAAAQGRGFDYRLATLEDYERAMLRFGIDDHVHRGELRSPDNSNILVGVLSARMYIKQRDFAVSSYLERVAEPLELLAWLHGGPDGLPALKQAWSLLLENSPHDSICGCSIDQTHREMMPRYDRSEQLAQQAAREAVQFLAPKMPVGSDGGLVIWRPVPHAPAIVQVEVPAHFAPTALRLPSGRIVPVAVGAASEPVVLQDERTSPRGVLRHLDFLREQRYDVHAIEEMGWFARRKRLSLETTVGDSVTVVDQDAVRREIENVVDAGIVESARVKVVHEGRRTLSFVLPPSDTIGLEVLEPATLDMKKAASDISVTKTSIANAFYRIDFDRGRLTLTDKVHGYKIRDFLTFWSEGDRGDEYNADILNDASLAIDRGQIPVRIAATATSASLEFGWYELGPTPLNVKRTRRTSLDFSGGGELSLRLWSSHPVLSISLKVINASRDTRIRAHIRLPFRIENAITENQFHVAERPIVPPKWNGRSNEQPPTTFPQKTFAAFEADGKGVAVFNRGLPEGEVVSDKKGRQAYALTLLRAVGWLSRNDLRTRKGGAGPMIETPDAQMFGAHDCHFALTTYRGDWRSAGIQPLAHAWAIPPVAWATNEHPGDLGRALPLARIPDPAVVPSAAHRSHLDGAPMVRVYNASDESRQATIEVPAGSAGAGTTDLLERHNQALYRNADGWRFPMRPWEITSVRFGKPAH